MGTVNIVKTIKQIYPSCMVLVKIGTFYTVYSKDAYIISYLLKYKIKEKNNIPESSFPVSSLSKVENILEKNKINYIVVNKRSNYEEEQKSINKQENNYEKMFKTAQKSISITLRIQKIYEILLNKSTQKNIVEKLKKIEMELQKND